jgi:hypothetical protein
MYLVINAELVGGGGQHGFEEIQAALERLVMGEGQFRPECPVLFVSGAPDTIRTSDLAFGG